jgi:hypothetical protein
MPTGQYVVHSTLTNDSTNTTKHQLHSPGYIKASAVEMNAITNAWVGDICFRTDLKQYFVFYSGSFHPFESSSFGVPYIWFTDPFMSVESGVLSFGNGQISSNGVVYNLSSGSISGLLGNRVIVGTLNSGSNTLVLSAEVVSYTLSDNQIFVGAYDITNDLFISLEQISQQAKSIIFSPTGTVFNSITAQGALGEVSNIFTGSKAIAAGFDFEFTGGQLRADPTQLFWQNGTITFLVSGTELYWSDGPSFFEASDSEIHWSNGAGLVFEVSSGQLTFSDSSVGAFLYASQYQLNWANASSPTEAFQVSTFGSTLLTTQDFVFNSKTINFKRNANTSSILILDGDTTPGTTLLDFGFQFPLIKTGGTMFFSSGGNGFRFQGTFGSSDFTLENTIALANFLNTGSFQINSGGDVFITPQGAASNVFVTTGSGGTAGQLVISSPNLNMNGTGFFTVNDSELQWQDGINTTFTINNTEIYWNISGSTTFQGSPTQLYWNNSVDTFLANHSEMYWSNGTTSITVDDTQTSWTNGTTTFTVDGTQIFWNDGTTVHIVDDSHVLWFNGVDVLNITHDGITFSGGPTTFLAQSAQLFWGDGAGTSFHAQPGNLFWGNGTTSFSVSDSGLFWNDGVSTFNFNDTNSGFITPGDLTIQSRVINLNCSIVQRTQDITNKATGGDIGTAADTVDIDSSFNVNQTTAAQTLTLPTPTTATAGLLAYVNNVGSTSFTMLGKVLPAGAGLIAKWTGAAWSLIGFGG